MAMAFLQQRSRNLLLRLSSPSYSHRTFSTAPLPLYAQIHKPTPLLSYKPHPSLDSSNNKCITLKITSSPDTTPRTLQIPLLHFYQNSPSNIHKTNFQKINIKSHPLINQDGTVDLKVLDIHLYDPLDATTHKLEYNPPVLASELDSCHTVSTCTFDKSNVHEVRRNEEMVWVCVKWCEGGESRVDYYDADFVVRWFDGVYCLEEEEKEEGRKSKRKAIASSSSLASSFSSSSNDSKWYLDPTVMETFLENKTILDSQMLRIPYSSLISSPSSSSSSSSSIQPFNTALYTTLTSLFLTPQSACIITHAPKSPPNAPPHTTPVTLLSNLLTLSLQPSHGNLYGLNFDVMSKPNSNNVAYTNVRLNQHQDLVYFDSPPGLQLLHTCVFQESCVGGESLLCDLFNVGEFMKIHYPLEYACLLNCGEGLFFKQRDSASMLFPRAYVTEDSFGNIVNCCWAPQFEGVSGRVRREDLALWWRGREIFGMLADDMWGGGIDVNGDEGRQGNNDSSKHFIGKEERKALNAFAKRNTWEHRLSEGEVLVFNNRRLVHGRRSFTRNDVNNSDNINLEKPIRHLQGCYGNIDEALNNFKVMLRKNVNGNGVEELRLLNSKERGAVGNGASCMPTW